MLNRYSVLDDGRVVFRYPGFQNEGPFEVAIKCPLPSKLHEEHAEILKKHRAWAKTFNIPPDAGGYQRYCDTRLDLLPAYQLYGLPVEAAVIHSHLMTWFFVFDDIMDIDHGLDEETDAYRSRLCARHLDILNGGAPGESEHGCLRAFYDFLQKVHELSKGRHPYWFGRMLYHLREYVLGAYWESRIGPTTDVNTNTALYLQVRHMAVGVAPCIDLMAIAAAIDAAPLADNFFIHRLERLAINYSIWINDLAGLGRDMKRGLGNIVFTLRKDHALSLADATRMVARMCDAELEAFREVERQMPMLLGNDYEKKRNAYDAYADVLKRWMRGLLDWSTRSERYQRADADMALQNGDLIRRDARKRPLGRS